MFNQFSVVFGRQWHTYTIAFIFGILISIAWMLFRSPAEKRAQVFDVCLAALIGAVVLGRIIQVALNWVFFVDRLDLIWQIHLEGGLNWQAAFISALIGGYAMARLRQLDTVPLMEHAIMILPFMALVSWYACATASCAYGASVDRMSDYPDFLTWIADDIYHLNMPRFATQALGMSLSFALLLIAFILDWRRWLLKTRFWWMLLLISIASFAIAFLRGDYALIWWGLRAGQVLDIAMMILAFAGIIWAHRSTPTEVVQ